ncbi:MFS multidrug transporter [Apiospora saccharicola]
MAEPKPVLWFTSLDADLIGQGRVNKVHLVSLTSLRAVRSQPNGLRGMTGYEATFDRAAALSISFGLQFLGMIVSSLIGEQIGGRLSDLWMNNKAKKLGHRPALASRDPGVFHQADDLERLGSPSPAMTCEGVAFRASDPLTDPNFPGTRRHRRADSIVNSSTIDGDQGEGHCIPSFPHPQCVEDHLEDGGPALTGGPCDRSAPFSTRHTLPTKL